MERESEPETIKIIFPHIHMILKKASQFGVCLINSEIY